MEFREQHLHAAVPLAMANVTSGDAYVDSVSVQEVLGNGQYGPNLVNEPSMEYELYVPEFLARQLDLTVEAAEKNNVFLKLVMIDKADKVFLKIQKTAPGDRTTRRISSAMAALSTKRGGCWPPITAMLRPAGVTPAAYIPGNSPTRGTLPTPITSSPRMRWAKS
jgi:hypothetical protein